MMGGVVGRSVPETPGLSGLDLKKLDEVLGAMVDKLRAVWTLFRAPDFDQFRILMPSSKCNLCLPKSHESNPTWPQHDNLWNNG
ncbi:unnamed protein product [Prunus armeniaca]|uniref:Uncharacterized protein n=1 Tax=Prunus armeniaca TaxID=36596 RepID=A0A6J5UBE0_PRUAR|nr:unnamed protein product [Prunus armeniaca]